ncbi:anaerobic ribonucleoside-triphosphate reductase [Elusimicrobium simillimum]|uniref:anaerobic ribonucleoside-triphosphate reductase n=1 Tax=Elusimicrobium simillimum TaxID=3143438 RepID=UPI003C7043EA
MTAKERTALETELAACKAQLSEVKGSKCEVYSRVCGYLRPITNWNHGKKEEFGMRKFMSVCK